MSPNITTIMDSHPLTTSSIFQLTLGLLVGYVLYWLSSAFYNVYLHPLANYPGSKLAAISTEWYEYYWNIYKPGQLLFEIERLHIQYGPVVRIGVNELHVNDPDFYLSITKTGSKFLKEPNFYRGIAFEHGSIGMIDPHKHFIRRQVLAPTFSASRVHQMSPDIDCKVRKLCGKLDISAKNKTPVSIHAAFKSFTMDIISEMVFGKEFGVMDRPKFHHPHLDVLQDAINKAWISRTFPTLCWFSLSLPEIVSGVLFPVPILEFGKQSRARVRQYVETRDISKSENKLNHQKEVRSSRKDVSVILEQLLDPNAARDHIVPNVKELNEEALNLLTAGNDTSANAMILGAYYICSHQEVKTKLVEELRKAFPSSDKAITYAAVKELPYITAVIKEVLRCANPLPGRLPRVVPAGGCTIDGKFLKPGVIVHTSAYLLNRHVSVWGENAKNFDPERWLQPSSNKLDKYMTSFYRGSRQCLGMHLAWCELYLIFAHLFLRYEVSIYGTTDEDMSWTDHLLMRFRKDFEVTIELRN